jgi:hypothetical protein
MEHGGLARRPINIDLKIEDVAKQSEVKSY